MVKFKELVDSHNGKANIWKQKNFIGQMTFGRDGFCSPLALKWIANRHIGMNFKEDTASVNGREEVIQLSLIRPKPLARNIFKNTLIRMELIIISPYHRKDMYN